MIKCLAVEGNGKILMMSMQRLKEGESPRAWY